MTIELDLTLGVSGHSHAYPWLAGLEGDGPGRHAFPAGWAVIRHPDQGVTLFDCGYGAPAREAMRRGLRRVYRTLLGARCPACGDAAALLPSLGIAPEDVRRVVISHFHPDHVGGLAAFPNARYIAHADAWRQVQAGPLARLHAQIWPELLPADFSDRLTLLALPQFVEPPADLAALGPCADLFGDSSLLAFELPGHAAGQIGLALRTHGTRVLLVADACWQRGQIDRPRALPWWARWLATNHAGAYAGTLARLRAFAQAHPDAWIIPSHCTRTLAAWTARHPRGVLPRAG